MEIDFDSEDRITDFSTVPAGEYLCLIEELRPGTTRAGDVRWSMLLRIVEGPYVGQMAAWDSIVFSQRGKARCRAVFKAIGLPVTGKVQIDPDDVVGRTAKVTVYPAHYHTPNGDAIIRNEVHYDGWKKP